MAIPALTHRSETWTLTKEAEAKAAKTKFLGTVVGYTLKYQIRKTVIRKKRNMYNLNNIIQNNGLNWMHHVDRMEPERIPKPLMDYTP
jgi:hypothetical protein